MYVFPVAASPGCTTLELVLQIVSRGSLLMAGWTFLFTGKRHFYGKGPGEQAEAGGSVLPREGRSRDATP